MCRVRSVASLIAFVIGAAGVAATAGEPQADQPKFRSGVHVVEVDVRVFDRSGQFIRDLTLDSFELLEDGVPQQLRTFYLFDPSAADPARAAAPMAPITSGSSAQPARHTWIFLFDLNHLAPGAGFDRARAAVEAFLRDRFRDGDLGGIVAGTRMVNNRLTSVREELATAVGSITPRTDARNRQIELTREWPRLQDESEALAIAREDAGALSRAVTRACSELPDRCRPVPPDLEIREKARRLQREIQQATMQTLTAVNGLASGLAKMAGPKTIVLLSDGFATQDMESTLRQVVGQAARAGARVYAIDVRGLNRGRGASFTDQPAVQDEAGGPATFDGSEDGPTSLAVDTGGMMIRNENNIGRALETIANDTTRFYVLAYQPANSALDGTFRTIQVRVKRADVRVRARRGYLALEPSRMLAPEPIRATHAATPGPAPTEIRGAEEASAAAPSTSGTMVGAPAAPAARGVRLRPDAEERVREVAGGDLATSDELAHRGWDAYQRGDVESALDSFIVAATRPDVRPWVMYALGLSQAALGRHADAAVSWERVRQAAPDFESIYMDLADAYIQLADVTRALGVLRDAEKRWPSDPEVHNAVGVLHVRRGALDDAIASFSKAAAAVPDGALAYFNLGRAYEMRYTRGVRYVSSQRRWTGSEDDRRKAAENYSRYLQLGGPYAGEASEALSRLEWAKK